MQIIPIHYKKSATVESWGQIRKVADELVKFVNETNGHFPGEHEKAFGIHHMQVCEDPFNFFVVDKEFVNDKMFPHQIIINPRIVSVDEKSRRPLNEACMSFPYRKEKKVDRYMNIRVAFQTPHVVAMVLGLKDYEVDASWPLSQIFQHEVDHANGKNIYYDEPK